MRTFAMNFNAQVCKVKRQREREREKCELWYAIVFHENGHRTCPIQKNSVVLTRRLNALQMRECVLAIATIALHFTAKMSISVTELLNASQMIIELIQLKIEHKKNCRM